MKIMFIFLPIPCSHRDNILTIDDWKTEKQIDQWFNPSK